MKQNGRPDFTATVSFCPPASGNASVRLQNCLLFCIKYFWRVLGVGLLQLGYWTLFVLFAPWTLLLLPVLGVWYILFLSQFLIYTQMNEAFSIEELYQSG